MVITTSQLKEIRTELEKLKPAKVTLDGNHGMTVKAAVEILAPTLERMKKRGFELPELVERLHEKGIDIKPQTLAKYLNEFRRRKGKKRDTPPPAASAGNRTVGTVRHDEAETRDNRIPSAISYEEL